MRTPVRAVAALGVLTLLTACSTSVTGTGRPAAAVSGSPAASTSPSASSSPSGSGSPSAVGTFDADGDAHETWAAAIAATISTGGSVTADGEISGAGIGGATIEATWSTDDDDNPVATVAIVTPEGGRLDVVATGGSAWSQATAAVYEEYGYAADASEEAAGQPVLLTDDSGLDVYAALETFLDLCGPSTGDPASLEDGTYRGQPVLVVNDEKYGTKAYVDPSNGLVLASVYQDQTVEFDYQDDRSTANAPPESDVITVDGF